MAGLQLNPSMNVMTLPFAAVVSVLAATMVFRNVFTAYDSFADRTLDPKYNSSAPKESTLRTGARILFNGNTTTVQTVQTTGEIPMGDYKAPDSSTIAVHKVVDVEVQGAAAAVSLLFSLFFTSSHFILAAEGRGEDLVNSRGFAIAYPLVKRIILFPLFSVSLGF